MADTPIIGQKPAGQARPVARPVTEAEFTTVVLEGSAVKPVVVDFMASWCAPCRQLAPALAAAVARFKGALDLVSVDIEASPNVAAQLNIQSIPAVLVFWQGQPVDGFLGARGEEAVFEVLERVAAHCGVKALEEADPLSRAAAAFERGDIVQAAQLYGEIFSNDGGNKDALAGMARCHIAAGEPLRARALLDSEVGKEAAGGGHEALATAKAALRLAEEGALLASAIPKLEKTVAGDGDDHDARLQLAKALFSAGRRKEAMAHLLESVRRRRDWRDGAARRLLLEFFTVLGAHHPLTTETRRDLASLLFS